MLLNINYCCSKSIVSHLRTHVSVVHINCKRQPLMWPMCRLYSLQLAVRLFHQSSQAEMHFFYFFQLVAFCVEPMRFFNFLQFVLSTSIWGFFSVLLFDIYAHMARFSITNREKKRVEIRIKADATETKISTNI